MAQTRRAASEGDHFSGNRSISVLLASRVSERGGTFCQLAEKFHVDSSTMSRILSGRRIPSAELLILIAHELGVSTDDLYRALMKSRKRDWRAKQGHSLK